MPRNCASCTHPQVREINHRIRDGRPLVDISRWLDDAGTPITRQALARHARDHVGVAPISGRRAVSGDFLETVRDTVHEGVIEGSIRLSARDGLAAQKQIDDRLNKAADRDMFAKIAMMMTGGYIEGEAREVDPEQAAIEAEFRPLLSSGAQ